MRRFLGAGVVAAGTIIAVVVVVLLLQSDVRGPHELSGLGGTGADSEGAGETDDAAAAARETPSTTPPAEEETNEPGSTAESDEAPPPSARPRPTPGGERPERARPDVSPRSEDQPPREIPIPTTRRPVPPPRRPSPSPPPADAEPPAESPMVETIRDEFNAVVPGIRQCYELLLALEPEASDRLIFALRVTADPDDPERGIVDLEGIESGEFVLEDLACFAEVVDAIELPPPGGDEEELLIRYPVILNAGPP